MLQAQPSLIFAGSFLHYSAIILEKLLDSPNLRIQGVLTTPPSSIGRTKDLQPNPVHQLALQHHLPVFTPTILDSEAMAEIETRTGVPEILLTAGYGKLLPLSWLEFPTVAALNLHFSLLPAYRGANPAEYALLRGETKTGVTLIEMSPTFDTGKMVAQAETTIADQETRETLYEKLYTLGGDVLPTMVEQYYSFRHDQPQDQFDSASPITFWLPPVEQGTSPTPYAQRLNRDDGFVAWDILTTLLAGQVASAEKLTARLAATLQSTKQPLTAEFMEQAVRALRGYPGVWTLVKTSKGQRRLKLLSAHLENRRLILDEVQLEGQAPSTWKQIQTALT